MPFADPEERRAYRREYQRKYHQALLAKDPEGVRANGREAARKHRERHPERVRERERGYKARRRETNPDYQSEQPLGLAPGTRARLLQKQNGLCAICRRNMHALSRIDHCHATGRLRELLCHHCNVALGHFNDDPERLEAAAAYIRKHATQDALSEQPSGPNREPPPHPATQNAPSP